MRWTQAAGVAFALGAIAFISLTPQAGSLVAPCFVCGERASADAVLNVAFYVPLGLALGVTRLSLLLSIVGASLVSSSMEAAQMLIPGRFPSSLDVLTNTAGAILGLTCARTGHSWIDPPAGTAAVFSAASAGLFTAVALATGFLTAPELPPGRYVGQWTPDLGRYEHYRGSVNRVAVGPYSVPSRALDNSEQIRDLIIGGEPLHIWGTAGPASSSLSAIFGLVRQFRTQLLFVGVSEDDLVLRFRQRAASWRLDQPFQYARGLMAGVPEGHDLHIELWRRGRTTCVSVNGRSDCALAATVGDGWGLLVNASPRSPASRWMLNATWLGLLTFPVGFWLRAGPRALPALLLVVTATAAAPSLTSLRSTPGEEWLAIGIGLAAGIGAHRVLRCTRRAAT